ncbi:MAG: peptide chain release factor-like protein [Candidatus Hydrogenedentota bacterium]|nr:MAG: peptide chain release factor-like protein [Candidatus Hydrogenedentota bacterium]
MSKFGVSFQKETALLKRMVENDLAESDLEEQFIRSGGPGGQHVNRTATCVYLKHLPTGMEVKMQQARSQGLNRYYARKRLCELVEAERLGEESPEAKKRDKIRKQKSRRKRRGRSATETGSD